METDHEKSVRLLVAAETLVEEECFAATRGDWQDVLTVQVRVDPLFQSLGALLADGALSAPQKERLAPRLQTLHRQQVEILAHIDTQRNRVASRLSAVETAAGRLRKMAHAYGPAAVRRAAVPPTLRKSA